MKKRRRNIPSPPPSSMAPGPPSAPRTAPSSSLSRKHLAALLRVACNRAAINLSDEARLCGRSDVVCTVFGQGSPLAFQLLANKTERQRGNASGQPGEVAPMPGGEHACALLEQWCIWVIGERWKKIPAGLVDTCQNRERGQFSLHVLRRIRRHIVRGVSLVHFASLWPPISGSLLSTSNGWVYRRLSLPCAIGKSDSSAYLRIFSVL